MVRLGKPAIGGANLGEVRIGLQLEHRQRAHLVARSAAVAGAAPAIMFGFGEAAGVTLFLGLARLGFLVAQAFEIIPVAVVFGGVLLAEDRKSTRLNSSH